MNNITPLPWSVHERFRVKGGGGIVATVTCPGIGKPAEIIEANAAFIVRAVNGHAALLAALENCTRLLSLINAPGTNDPIESAVFKARAALNAAK